VNKRSGPFWDAMEGRAPLPRAAATLGLEPIHVDADSGSIELACAAREDFTNPTSNVLGARPRSRRSLTRSMAVQVGLHGITVYIAGAIHFLASERATPPTSGRSVLTAHQAEALPWAPVPMT
jgi:hypothetical protein